MVDVFTTNFFPLQFCRISSPDGLPKPKSTSGPHEERKRQVYHQNQSLACGYFHGNAFKPISYCQLQNPYK